MFTNASKILLTLSFAAVMALTAGLGFAIAQGTGDPIATEINSLKVEIEQKKSNIDQIHRKIDSYNEKIAEKQSEAASLNGELELLENRMAKTDLEIQATQEEIATVNQELVLIDKELGLLEKSLDEDRKILVAILQNMQELDNSTEMSVVFGTESFSELFDQLQYLENVNEDLGKTLERAKANKLALEDKRVSESGKKANLTDLKKNLERSKQLAEAESTAKETILLETQQSESQFHALLRALRSEQAYIDSQIAQLQGKIEAKLYAHDDLGGDTLLTWPVDPGYKGISAYFHDPTYPYRHLFEHSGIDVPQRQGSVIKSPAPGYVAWTRTGRMYGNYVMVIHANGIATLYAHMSRIDVVPDQFLSRGSQIGLTGGLAGSPGAGLSTGPHLHFEVRKNGIPVNPLDYLVDSL